MAVSRLIAAFMMLSVVAICQAQTSASSPPVNTVPTGVYKAPDVFFDFLEPPNRFFGKKGGDMISSLPLGNIPFPRTTIFVRSRADRPIFFGLINQSGNLCANETVDPGAIIEFPFCGKSLKWHNGKDYKSINVVLNHCYEFKWDGNAWDVSDVTPPTQDIEPVIQ